MTWSPLLVVPLWLTTLLTTTLGSAHDVVTAASGLYPVSDYDCSQNDIGCTIFRDPYCSWSDNSKPENLAAFPGPVTDLSILPFHLAPKTPVPESRSKVVISWGLPTQGSLLTAFKLRFTQANGERYCFVLKLNRTDVLEPRNAERYYQYNFSLTVDYLPTRCYTVDVWPQPEADFSQMRASAMLCVIQKHRDDPTHKECQNGRPPRLACWDTDLVVYNDPCTRTIKVVFSRPPENLKIAQLKIYLAPNVQFPSPDILTNKTYDVTNSQSQFLYGVLDVSSFLYPLTNRQIWVSPNCSGDCRFSVTRTPFNVTKGTEKTCTFQVPYRPKSTLPGLSSQGIAAIILVAITVAAALTTTVILLARRGTGPTGTAPPYPDTGPNTYVYLVYFDDNFPHLCVVNSLVTLIRAKGGSVVFESPRRERLEDSWFDRMRQQLEHCDFILVVHSEGAYTKAQEYLAMENDGRNLDALDKFLLTYQQLDDYSRLRDTAIMDKVLFCQFDYTPPDVCVPLYGSQGQASYRLMADMNKLLARLNVTESDDDHNKARGNLENAITRMKLWMSKRNTCLGQTSGQFDSGFSELQHQPTESLRATNDGTLVEHYQGQPTVPPGDASVNVQAANLPIVWPDDPGEMETLNGSVIGRNLDSINLLDTVKDW